MPRGFFIMSSPTTQFSSRPMWSIRMVMMWLEPEDSVGRLGKEILGALNWMLADPAPYELSLMDTGWLLKYTEKSLEGRPPMISRVVVAFRSPVRYRLLPDTVAVRTR